MILRFAHKRLSRAVGRASEKVRNQALFAMSASLRGNMADITLAGNKVDMEAGKARRHVVWLAR